MGDRGPGQPARGGGGAAGTTRRPAADDTPGGPAQLLRLLREATDALANEWSQRLAEVTVRLIEGAGFHLAGARGGDAAVDGGFIEQVLQHHEAPL
ncbi:MAG: hypothetical protein U0797_01475 [Gemmataceae bacterium]